jgi:hypothetical protein
MFQYFLLFAYNKALSLYYSVFKLSEPISWHRQLFGHYLFMIPLDVSLLGDDEVIMKTLCRLPYFNMGSIHRNIFIEEFGGFLGTKRRELFTNLYAFNTDLSLHEIEQRISSIELILREYTGTAKLEHLTGFFILDQSLPDEIVEELKREILNCLTFSMQFRVSQM